MRIFNVIAFCSVRNTAQFWVCLVLCAQDYKKKDLLAFFAMLSFAVEAQLKI